MESRSRNTATCLMNDGLISLMMETQSLVDALHSADIHVGSLSSNTAKTMREVVERRLGGHSRPQIKQH